MKTYEAVFDEDRVDGVYALSVVNDPAMEDMFVAFDNHPKEVQFSAIDTDKRLLLGACLIPDKKIYRNVDGEEFYITMSEQTIEKLAHAFLKNGNQGNSSLDHEVKLENMSVVETWIVQDPNKDKSNLYGKTYEKGTWVAMMKVDNEDVWQLAKQGDIRGFSIEALLGMTEINYKQETMNKEDLKSFKDELIDSVKTIFNSDKEEVSEPIAEEVVEAQPEAEVEASSFDAEAFAKEIGDILANFKKEVKTEIAEFSKQREDLAKENETLKAELSKTPEAEAIKVTPVTSDVKLNKQGTILEILRQNR
jgi:arsenate reductase-like glutaredoxin family protein